MSATFIRCPFLSLLNFSDVFSLRFFVFSHARSLLPPLRLYNMVNTPCSIVRQNSLIGLEFFCVLLLAKLLRVGWIASLCNTLSSSDLTSIYQPKGNIWLGPGCLNQFWGVPPGKVHARSIQWWYTSVISVLYYFRFTFMTILSLLLDS